MVLRPLKWLCTYIRVSGNGNHRGDMIYNIHPGGKPDMVWRRWTGQVVRALRDASRGRGTTMFSD